MRYFPHFISAYAKTKIIEIDQDCDTDTVM